MKAPPACCREQDDGGNKGQAKMLRCDLSGVDNRVMLPQLLPAFAYLRQFCCNVL
jgi:hypothetical protein